MVGLIAIPLSSSGALTPRLVLLPFVGRIYSYEAIVFMNKVQSHGLLMLQRFC